MTDPREIKEEIAKLRRLANEAYRNSSSYGECDVNIDEFPVRDSEEEAHWLKKGMDYEQQAIELEKEL